MSDHAAGAQRAYYDRTGASYHEAHVTPGDEHFVALEYAAGLMKMFSCQSVLDVGAGTGRALRFLVDRQPGLDAHGVEPSAALRAQATEDGLDVVDGDGQALPYPAEAFDAVIATGVIHHVAQPELLVAELTRVARRLVLISDSNRFGQGRPPVRVAKVLIHKAGAWSVFERVRTRGKGYMESEGDGIFYSYSVHDSHSQVATWADRTFIIPTTSSRHGVFGSLTESSHGLLVGVREPSTGWAGHRSA